MSNVIDLQRFRRDRGHDRGCAHREVTLKESGASVMCDLCGQKLSLEWLMVAVRSATYGRHE
jgi:hypothetical protein